MYALIQRQWDELIELSTQFTDPDELVAMREFVRVQYALAQMPCNVKKTIEDILRHRAVVIS